MKKLLSIILVLFAFLSTVQATTAVKMSAEEKKKLDTFFSNFSEANLPAFKPGGLTDEMLLDFARLHIILNASQKLKTINDGNDALIPKELVDKVTRRYFDRVISKHTEPVYTVNMGSGEAFVFSQIDSLAQLDNGLLEARGTVYYTGSGETFDTHASPATWQKKEIDVQSSMTFTAVIRKIKQDGRERYILLEYATREKNQ